MTTTKKITELTPEQEARFDYYIDKWTKIGLSTKPCDRPKTQKAITELYKMAGLDAPRFVWTPCPLSAALAASIMCDRQFTPKSA